MKFVCKYYFNLNPFQSLQPETITALQQHWTGSIILYWVTFSQNARL